MRIYIKITKTILDLLTYNDVILDYENSIRKTEWGKIIRHYREANHKYMYDYNETKGSISMQYLNFNNQHACNLSESISNKGFQFGENSFMSTYNFITNWTSRILATIL